MTDDDRTTTAAGAASDRPPGRWSATLNRTHGVVDRWSAAGAATADRIRSAAGRTGATDAPIWRTTSRALAVAGALVGAGSIGGDWIRFKIPGVTVDGNGDYTAGMMVAELGSYGTAYLVGFLALIVAAALALFGTTRIRTDVRVGALALGVGLLTLLAVVAMNADGLLRATYRIGPDLIVQTTVGPGLTAAVVSVGVLLAAVHLGGRAASTPPTSPVATNDLRDRPEQPMSTTPEPELGPPADLTVSPTEPFVRPENPPPQTRRW
jgi:hypothetical protein